MDLAINNVTDLCNFVGEDGLCVCVCVCLLRSFITFSTHQNQFDKHIAYFNQNSWFKKSGMGN